MLTLVFHKELIYAIGKILLGHLDWMPWQANLSGDLRTFSYEFFSYLDNQLIVLKALEKGKNICNLIFLHLWHGNFLLVYFFCLKSLTWIPKKMDVQPNGFEKPRHATLSMFYNLVCIQCLESKLLQNSFQNIS